MSTLLSPPSIYPLIDEHALIGVLPVPSRAWHLQQLQTECAFSERLLRSQPSLERVSREAFQQALDYVFVGRHLDPDTILLIERMPPGAAQRSMTQAVRDVLESGSLLESTRITGFSQVTDAAVAQRLTGVEPGVFADLLNRHIQALVENFSQRLSRFWRNPVLQGNELTMRDTWLRYRCGELAEEAALRRADNLAHPDTGLTAGGMELVHGLVGSQLQLASPVSQVAAYRLVVEGAKQAINLAGAFVLGGVGELSGSRPLLLYTPQRGLEEFASTITLLNALGVRWGAAQGCDEILANVAMPDLESMQALCGSGQASWTLVEMSSDAHGSLLGQILDEKLAQQQVNLRAAFLPLRPGINARVSQVLALPTGLPADLLSRPLRPDTLPVLPSVGLSVGDQQHNLIGQLAKLNALVDKLLKGMPEFDAFLQQQLRKLFPGFTGPVSPQQIYFTRSRLDQHGLEQPSESHTLESRLGRLLGVGADVDDRVGEYYYVEPDTLSEEYRLNQVGTLGGLATALKQEFPRLLSEFWNTFQKGRGLRMELLTRLRKQALATESALRTVDGTLTPASRELIDNALKFPTSAARALAFPGTRRPQVYRLALTDGARFATAFILSPDSASPPSGPLVLWTITQGFEEFCDLGALYAELARRLDDGGVEGALLADNLSVEVREKQTDQWAALFALAPDAITGDFVADGTQALLAKQRQDLKHTLSAKNQLRPGVVDTAIDLAPQLDISTAFMARNRLLEASMMPPWQKALSAQDQLRLQALALVVQEKNQALSVLLGAVPSLLTYTRQKLRGKLRSVLEARGLPGTSVELIDPDTVIVTRSERVRVNQTPAPGVIDPIERVTIERMSLTDLALKNLNPWEGSLSWTSSVSIGAYVTYADGRRVVDARGEALQLSRETIELWVRDINAGHHYCRDILNKTFAPPAISAQASQLAQTWMSANAALLEYAAESARLNPTAYSVVSANDSAKKRAEQWVAAVLGAWGAQARPKVDGRGVEASFLMLGTPDVAPEQGGSQWVQGVVVISAAEVAEWVLYTPDAPDGLDLRELRNEAELIALLGMPQWQAYFLARLCVRSPQVIEPVVHFGLYLTGLEPILSLFLSDTSTVQERLPPLIVRRVTCEGSLLQSMYYLQILRLMERAQRGSVTNEQVSLQSTFNKVMFGIEVVGALMDMLPWGWHWLSSIPGYWRRLSHTSLLAFRERGEAIPGLLVREGLGKRWLRMQSATDSVELLGVKPLASQSSSLEHLAVRTRPLLHLPTPQKLDSLIPLAWKASAVPEKEAAGLLRGLVPNSRGIYRTSAGDYLIRPVDAQGKSVVFRIKGDFRLYESAGLAVQVVDAHGRREIGFLYAAGNGRWRPVGVKGGGRAASRQALDLPGEEYLLTGDYSRNAHGRASLSQASIEYYDAWFARDWRRFFTSRVLPPRPAPLALPPLATVDDLLDVWPEQVVGLVLGENHDEIASIAFFKDRMQALYDRGFRTLYIEGSHAIGRSQLYISPVSTTGRNTIKRLARSRGMNVRGLDDDHLTLHRDRYTLQPSIDMSVRLNEMNYFAARQIEKYHPVDGGKWIAWVGARHTNTADGVTGIAELMGALGVRVKNAKAGQPTVVRAPGKRSGLWGGFRPDVEIEWDVSLCAPRLPEGPSA